MSSQLHKGSRRMRAAALAGAALLAAVPAMASETIKYAYDARGRLMKLVHSGTVNGGVTACYLYERADNRTNVKVATSDCSASFSVNDVSATEGSSLVFTVTKSGGTSGTYSVKYATANGSAAAGSDYTATSGTLSFTSSETTKTVSVATSDDTTAENAELLYLNLSGASGAATISDSQGRGTINDNDSTTTHPSFSVSNASATEGSAVVFTITKSGSTTSSYSVNYATANNTAVSTEDYTAASGTLTFAASETSKTVSVSTFDDTVFEGDETFYLNLSGASGGSTISDTQGVGTIVENDTLEDPMCGDVPC